MSKAIITFGTGHCEELLEIAAPSFRAFAEKHGYDLYKCATIGKGRPAAWYKLPNIRQALNNYDEVLWLGADLVIVDGSEDLKVPADAWQALVEHHTGDGDVPNTEVWLCRKPMIPLLEKAWNMNWWLMHGWWEQAAILELMGYHVKQPAHLIAPTELYEHTYFLDPSWNVHKWHQPQPDNPKIKHATMYKDRAMIMRGWMIEAQGWMNNSKEKE